MPAILLHQQDARIVYLATVYHLGRPGSEAEAATIDPSGTGLGELREALELHIAGAENGGAAADANSLEVNLSAYQLARLGTALHGTVNELKQFGLAEGRSAVPGFADAVALAFPDASDLEPGDAALEVVPDAVMLRRRLDAAVRNAESEVEAARIARAEQQREARRPRWRRWLGRVRGWLDR